EGELHLGEIYGGRSRQLLERPRHQLSSGRVRHPRDGLPPVPCSSAAGAELEACCATDVVARGQARVLVRVPEVGVLLRDERRRSRDGSACTRKTCGHESTDESPVQPATPIHITDLTGEIVLARPDAYERVQRTVPKHVAEGDAEAGPEHAADQSVAANRRADVRI